MIDQDIIQKAIDLKVIDKINLERTVQIKRKVPSYLRKLTSKHEMVVFGDGSLLEYHNQPLMVIPLNDYLAMLRSVKIPKRRKPKNDSQKD